MIEVGLIVAKYDENTMLAASAGAGTFYKWVIKIEVLTLRISNSESFVIKTGFNSDFLNVNEILVLAGNITLKILERKIYRTADGIIHQCD